MESNKDHLEAIRDIKNYMEMSSRYLPLSGIAGIVNGLLSLIVAWIVKTKIEFNSTNQSILLLLFGSLLLISLLVEIVMAERNAKRKQIDAWDSTAKRFLINLFIPLLAGGIYCLILFNAEQFDLVLPATLIFYGLALINSSKYTIADIRLLGIIELSLGLIASYYTESGLLFWATGFGILHIVYGILIYQKHEKTKA